MLRDGPEVVVKVQQCVTYPFSRVLAAGVCERAIRNVSEVVTRVEVPCPTHPLHNLPCAITASVRCCCSLRIASSISRILAGRQYHVTSAIGFKCCITFLLLYLHRSGRCFSQLWVVVCDSRMHTGIVSGVKPRAQRRRPLC